MSPQDLAGHSETILIREGAVASRVTLEPMTAVAAKSIGSAFAAIDPWVSYPFPASGLTSYFSAYEAGAPRFLVCDEGEIAGAIGLRKNWLRGPYLQFLGLLPGHQKHGLGQLLLAWFEGSARAAGDSNLWVAASDFNADALRFYERHGFSRVAALEGLVRDEKTELLLRKRL